MAPKYVSTPPLYILGSADPNQEFGAKNMSLFMFLDLLTWIKS
jgi:hypothetical protein